MQHYSDLFNSNAKKVLFVVINEMRATSNMINNNNKQRVGEERKQERREDELSFILHIRI